MLCIQESVYLKKMVQDGAASTSRAPPLCPSGCQWLPALCSCHVSIVNHTDMTAITRRDRVNLDGKLRSRFPSLPWKAGVRIFAGRSRACYAAFGIGDAGAGAGLAAV